MQKGKYGIILGFYPTVAFILAILGQTLLCGLVLAFVIVAEQNEWASKQAIQAFCLSLFSGIITVITSSLSVLSVIPFIGAAVIGIFGFISGIISLCILIISIIAITKVVKGKDANIPLANKFANWAYGLVVQKVYTTTEQV